MGGLYAGRYSNCARTMVYEPHVHEVRAGLADLLGDVATRERELREAHRLYTDTLVVGPSFERSGETDSSREAGARLLAAAKGLIGGLESVELDRVTLGWRPMPRDERPVIGFCDGTAGLYVAVMHSGVTLAPLVGRLAASELLEGVAVDLLEPYRPSRF